MANLDSSDPVTCGLRASARQLAGVAVFSGVVNLLTLSGSIYMLWGQAAPFLVGAFVTLPAAWLVGRLRGAHAASDPPG